MTRQHDKRVRHLRAQREQRSRERARARDEAARHIEMLEERRTDDPQTPEAWAAVWGVNS